MSSLTNKTQDFLFELGCEELPPKALPKLGKALLKSVAEAFDGLELNYQKSEWFGTPRRIAIRFSQLEAAQQDKQVEKLGPAVAAAFDADGKAKPAALGFAKSNGVDVADLQRKQTDKGERLAYIADVKGQKTNALLQDILQKAISQLPVPKAMRWGASSFQFSRPVHWLVALLDDKIVDIEVFGVKAGNLSYGHRFHAPQEIVITSPSEYEKLMTNGYVSACYQKRMAAIDQQVKEIASGLNANAVISDALLQEVTALVEWPQALLGNFETEFLQVPAEALISSMAEHQKYFHLLDKQGNLLPNFITISNIESKNPQSVIEGNEKVIRPRLADAKFFYDSDRKHHLSHFIERLRKVVFQTKLGTIYDKTQRIKSLAEKISQQIDVDETLVSRAAELCKCDLMTDMVGEFSDLQGIMGRYYAEKDGEPEDVAAAMDEIYMPRFAGDQLPKTTTGTILAIADRVDTMVGIFGIGQIPTGAKDPFALRRASLGVLRLITENKLALDLSELIDWSLTIYASTELNTLSQDTKKGLLDFFAARTNSLYQEKGIAVPVIKSVQALNVTQPTEFEQRVVAVADFSTKPESNDLAEANKRVKNILDKSDFDFDNHSLNIDLFEKEELELYQKIESIRDDVNSDVLKSDFSTALDKLATLKDPVNLFFDKVMINAEDKATRENRLTLISRLRRLFIGIADISLLQK
jgi:glycyl-tRNA synthetase beta chain